MDGLPSRGAAVRELGLALPPGRMRAWSARRPLKRWRYVGVYAPDLMLCVGDARIGPLPQRWWAVALPHGRLRERTTVGRGGVSVAGPPAAASAAASPTRVRASAKGVTIELELAESDGIETASPVGGRGAYIWTRKQACLPVRGRVELDGAVHELDGPYGFVDDSAGYHARHTAWRWSAGIGVLEDGRRVGWNLVAGIHDAPQASERTLWIEGEPVELGAVAFADDLSSVRFADGAQLDFAEWSRREADANALLIRSRYVQPFGAFAGTLPGGLRLAHGRGVMEEHDVRW
jgi:hypothetical protein